VSNAVRIQFDSLTLGGSRLPVVGLEGDIAAKRMYGLR
jgi:hypothetical protein